MIKLLVVDDEVFVRVGLATAVMWNENGLELVGSAEDGQAALEQCRRLLPDIVLVDIKMGGMDGLTFIEKARLEFPGMRFIILSCHNDFQYMQKAIRLGVDDYIIKNTVQPQELMEAVLKVADGILPDDGEKSEEEHNTALALLSGKAVSLKALGLKTPLWAAAIEIVNRDVLVRNYKGTALDKIITGVVKLASEVIASDYCCAVSRHIDIGLAAVVCVKDNITATSEDIEKLILRVAAVLKKFLNVEIAAGIGRPAQTPDEIRWSWEDAQMALTLRFYQRERMIIVHPGFKAADDGLARAMEAKQRVLELTHAGKVAEAAERFTLMLHEAVAAAALDPQKLKVLCAGAIEEQYMYLHSTGIIDETIMTEQVHILIEHILGSRDANELTVTVNTAMQTITSFIRENISINRDIIRQLCQYIDVNIGGVLSLAVLSQQARMSQGHLSRVFKQEMGENLQCYIQRKRIDRARELAVFALPFDEIAALCGFENPSSFSRAFRHGTGMTFRDYRRLRRQ